MIKFDILADIVYSILIVCNTIILFKFRGV